jgi:hypothetical protein
VISDHCQPTASAPQFGGFRAGRGRAAIVGILGLLLLGGCTSSSSQTAAIFGGLIAPEEPTAPAPVAAPAPQPQPMAQLDRGSCSGAAQCKVMLKTMIDSPDRGWIGQRQPPDVYANGTRLFAYRALRRQLTCGELSMAVDELSAVSKSLGGAVSGMTPDQVSRTRALCSQVEVELAKEREGRCRT